MHRVTCIIACFYIYMMIVVESAIVSLWFPLFVQLTWFSYLITLVQLFDFYLIYKYICKFRQFIMRTSNGQTLEIALHIFICSNMRMKS